MVYKMLQDRVPVPSVELRDRLGTESVGSVLQRNRLRWFGHLQRKVYDNWSKKCMEYPRLDGPNMRVDER